jgi:hypothetical protein
MDFASQTLNKQTNRFPKAQTATDSIQNQVILGSFSGVRIDFKQGATYKGV